MVSEKEKANSRWAHSPGRQMPYDVLVYLREIGAKVSEQVVGVFVKTQLVHYAHFEVAVVELVHKRVPEPQATQEGQDLSAFVTVELIEAV